MNSISPEVLKPRYTRLTVVRPAILVLLGDPSIGPERLGRVQMDERSESGRFSACMGELDADGCSLRVRELDDSLERGDLTVLPQSLKRVVCQQVAETSSEGHVPRPRVRFGPREPLLSLRHRLHRLRAVQIHPDEQGGNPSRGRCRSCTYTSATGTCQTFDTSFVSMLVNTHHPYPVLERHPTECDGLEQERYFLVLRVHALQMRSTMNQHNDRGVQVGRWTYGWQRCADSGLVEREELARAGYGFADVLCHSGSTRSESTAGRLRASIDERVSNSPG